MIHLQNKLQQSLLAQDWTTLVRLCQRALRKNRLNQQAHRLLGFALDKQGQTDAAIQAFEQAAVLFPNDAELLINYANVLINHIENVKALPLLEKVCALQPNQAVSWLKLAECCYLLTQHEKGFDAAQRGAELAKDDAERVSALMQKAIHRRELGQIQQAVKDCESAIALNPHDVGNHTNRLLFMLADPQADAVQVANAAREFGAIFETPLKPHWPSFTERDQSPWRRLKIGFLSPDFRMHSVMYFVEGLLAQLDRRQFEVYAFYLFPKDDHITERVQRHADHFIRLTDLSAPAQADAIRSHNIDILIDLAGHTGHNGLLAMAHKAAPIQVSWLGFPATTGLQAVDYKFTDEVTDPPDVDDQYTERLYRLPLLFVCYRPMSRNPLWRYQPAYLVRPTPALNNGCVTFGSCNNLGKLTDDVLRLWGQLLDTLPDARLLIEGKNLNLPDFAAQYRQRCANLGIDTRRLELVGLHTDNQYLTYHRIDIALDPFPLTGGTTTFDVLWMGVPIVSMVGDSFKSRMGVGILTYLGRTQWIAKNEADYLRIAVDLARDIDALNALRLGLRAELEQSVLMREDLFNLHFGQGLRHMWLQWLAKSVHPTDAQAQLQVANEWLLQRPVALAASPEPSVGLTTGTRLSLPAAHEKLQESVNRAKAKPAVATRDRNLITTTHWKEVTELAETVLCAVPHDPVALACLAEVELAHGHADFALTYLGYVQESLQKQQPAV